MDVKIIKIPVYIGRNSPYTIRDIKLNGAAYNLSTENITKVGVVIGSNEYLSTDGFIVFDERNVTLKLGTIPNPPKTSLPGRLIAYSNEYPLGRPIFTERTKTRLLFEFF